MSQHVWVYVYECICWLSVSVAPSVLGPIRPKWTGPKRSRPFPTRPRKFGDRFDPSTKFSLTRPRLDWTVPVWTGPLLDWWDHWDHRRVTPSGPYFSPLPVGSRSPSDIGHHFCQAILSPRKLRNVTWLLAVALCQSRFLPRLCCIPLCFVNSSTGGLGGVETLVQRSIRPWKLFVTIHFPITIVVVDYKR